MEKEVEEKKEQSFLEEELVIEENTIYEIDRECMSCLKKGKNEK